MTVSEKIKTINNKIKQNKAHRNLDGETAKISNLSSANVGKYVFFNTQRENTCQKKQLQLKDLNVFR